MGLIRAARAMISGMEEISSGESSEGLSSNPKEPHMRATWERYSMEMFLPVSPLGTLETWQPIAEGG